MTQPTVIPKDFLLNKSEDYAFLRAEGISYIEQLSSQLWTDYNDHDPGITLLENICYAITELGYRTNLDIKDILASDQSIDPQEAAPLFTAREILTVNPVTITDFRKVLVDVPGVKNAWLSLADGQAVPFFAACKESQLQYSPETEHPIRIRGLYEVLLQFEMDDRYGDLNSPIAKYTLGEQASSTIKNGELQVVMSDWNTINQQLEIYQPFLNADTFSGQLTNTDVVSSEHRIIADLEISYQDNGTTKTLNFPGLEFLGIADLTILKNHLPGFLQFFHGKLNSSLKVTNAVENRLHQCRNLCEDIKNISGIQINNVAICADIILENNASLIDVQAQILFEVQQYISPDIRFYSLREMVEMDQSSETIFNGPALDHGFIIDEEIEQSSLDNRKYIYASDIINIIQDIPGVVAVNDLLLTKYKSDGTVVLPSERWCVRIDEKHKASLDLSVSKLLFFKDDLPYVLSGEKYKLMLKKVAQLNTLNEKNKLLQTNLDYDIPEGTPGNLSDYTPLRMALPQTYGVGETGLPANASPARIAQAEQLKVFLTFFDQLLGNYLSQLANVKSLLSANPQIVEKEKITYYNQFLEEELIGGDLYVDSSSLQNNDPGPFLPDSLQRLSESKEDYLDRRNRFLDHLLARFAENFSDYALMVFDTIDNDNRQELINDKVSFLQRYPEISAERGKAFNYKNKDELWQTENVAGLKKRVSKLLGMPDFLRQSYHCPSIRNEFVVIENGINFSFQVKQGVEVLLSSPKLFADEAAAFTAKEKAVDLAQEDANYLIEASGSGFVFKVGVLHPSDASLHDVYLESSVFTTEDKAKFAALDFRKQVSQDFAADYLYYFFTIENTGNFNFQLANRNESLFTSINTYSDQTTNLADLQNAENLAADSTNYAVRPDAAKFRIQLGYIDIVDSSLSTILAESNQVFGTEEEAWQFIFSLSESIKRSALYGQFYKIHLINNAGNFDFNLFPKNGPTLISQNNYPDQPTALNIIGQVLRLSILEYHYTFQETGGNFNFQIGIVDRDENDQSVVSNKVLAKTDDSYPSEEAAQQAAEDNRRAIAASPRCNIEGFHLLEHILLRPKHVNVDHFMEVCLDRECPVCGEEDPYSFRASAVFPYWTRKFSINDPKLKKRAYVERILRQEAPAHVHLKICWIDNQQMRRLDAYYRRWLEINAEQFPDPAILSQRLNALLEILGQLRNRYPEGFLHDCDDSEEENTIILGKSFLGAYNSPED